MSGLIGLLRTAGEWNCAHDDLRRCAGWLQNATWRTQIEHSKGKRERERIRRMPIGDIV